MPKPPVIDELSTWVKLLNAIRHADEERCRYLLNQELMGRRRAVFIKRIHGRLNVVRSVRERLEFNHEDDQ